MRSWHAYVRQQLPSLNLPPAREVEIVEELADQLEHCYRDALAAGHSEQEAERLAEAQIPDWKRVARELRDATGAPERAPWWTGMPADLSSALRVLTGQPAVTLTVVLTLAVGLGACVAIYSLLEAVVLRQLPFRDPQQLVMLWEANQKRGFKNNVVAPADLLDWRARATSFSGISAYTTGKRTLTGQGEPVELEVQAVTPNHLSVLGIQPVMGRDFRPEEIRADSRLLLLSQSAWRRHFSSRPDIVGQRVSLGGELYEVIGLLPELYPTSAKPVDAVAPLYLDPGRDYRQKAGRYLLSIGRLKSGVSIQQASAEMSGIAAQLEQEHPLFNKNWGVRLVPLGEQYSQKVRIALWVLMAATLLTLLIACANVANLLLARSAGREREMAIRRSMGASDWRVVRQLLAESLGLALVSGLAGLALAYGLIAMLKYFAPAQVPRLESATLNPAVLLFAGALTVGTGVLFGMAPALALRRDELAGTLKEGARGILGGAGDRWRAALMVLEMALALVLLVGSGVLIRTLDRLLAVDTGFDTHHVLTMEVGLPATRYRDEEVSRFYARWLERVRTLPGVESAGAVTWLPFGQGAGTSYRVVGRPIPAAGESPVTDVRPVHPGYFETLRFPLKAGRLFTDEDNRAQAPRHFVVNEALVRQQFSGKNPLGQKLIVNMGDDVPGEIIGVIGDVRIGGLSNEVRAQVYYPHAHLPINFASITVRTAGDPLRLAPAVLRELRALDPLLPATEIATMDDRLSVSVAEQRFFTALLTCFSAMALFLALVGVYSVTAYTVEQRTHEIGVRLALGAAPRQVLGWIVTRGLILAGVGATLGLAGTFAAQRLLQQLPFEVAPSGTTVFAGGIALLLVTALLAMLIPARRATQVDPMVALRYE